MFNLDQAITEWRQQMLAAGIKTPVPMEELESHLRDDVEEKMRLGLGEQAAFIAAAGQMGQAEVLKSEFIKFGDPLSKRLQQFLYIIAGIPNPQLATNMNPTHPSSPLEPRWATYLKTAAFALPAAFMWLFCVVFIMPKLRQLCQQANLPLFTFPHAPAIFQAFAFVAQGLFVLTQYGMFISTALLGVFLLLEWRSVTWPRYRRAVLGTGTFVLNVAVLASITLMVVSAIVAMSSLPHLK